VTLRKRILTGVLAVVALAIVSLAVALSYESPCGEPTALPEQAERMKAIVLRCYGPPEVLKLEEVAIPTAADNEVLVRVRAAAVNPLDWHRLRGSPYIMRLPDGFGAPKDTRMGVDFAGTVEAVGKSVTQFKPGDEVFGGRSGALAEYLTVREDRALVHKPPNMTFEQAAAIPVAAVTALQGLRDKGQIQPGQKVLINGASGGVGTFAVQIAKSFGAEVIGVCSTRNVDLVRSIGADHVIDYKQENFTEGNQRYDLIIDNVGNHGVLKLRGVLKPSGKIVIIGGPKGNWLGPFSGVIQAIVVSPFVDEEIGMFIADLNQKDLNLLADLAREGKITSVINRRYTLDQVPEAIAYLEEGHVRGKVVIGIEERML
jgi:NADPH:quinone reductase-like Zn-dependent oxidoreductase